MSPTEQQKRYGPPTRDQISQGFWRFFWEAPGKLKAAGHSLRVAITSKSNLPTSIAGVLSVVLGYVDHYPMYFTKYPMLQSIASYYYFVGGAGIALSKFGGAGSSLPQAVSNNLLTAISSVTGQHPDGKQELDPEKIRALALAVLRETPKQTEVKQ